MDNAATVYGGQTAVQPSRKSFELGRLAPPPELASPFFHQSVPIHVAGRGFGKQPGQAMDTTSRLPFTSTVSGMSMKLASLNTKFSQDLLHSEASQQRGAYRMQLASAASSELSDSMGGRDPLITILGGQRSVGNWWSQDDLSALPMEHLANSSCAVQARVGRDGMHNKLRGAGKAGEITPAESRASQMRLVGWRERGSGTVVGRKSA
eukprot:jgi/Tetstr1/453758/TSEL_040710.t1